MHPLAGRRGKAYLLDCARIVGVGVALIPLGVIAHRRGLIGPYPVRSHLVSAVLPLIATVWAAREESGPAHATRGKRGQQLTVTTEDGTPMSFRAALLRNTVKIAIPWQLGHTVAIGAAYGGFERKDPITLGAAVVTYPLVGVLIGSVVRGRGRAIHDRVGGSVVRGSADVRPVPGHDRT